MSRTMAGTTCPRCHQHARPRKDGTLGQHRTDLYVPFTNRRERCSFAGVTPREAQAGVTGLVKRTVAFHTTGKAPAEQKARFAAKPHWRRWVQIIAECAGAEGVKL